MLSPCDPHNAESSSSASPVTCASFSEIASTAVAFPSSDLLKVITT